MNLIYDLFFFINNYTTEHLVKMYEYSLTHYQTISLIIINFLQDPSLVRYFISVLRKTEIDDSRNYHKGRHKISPVGRHSQLRIKYDKLCPHIRYFGNVRDGFLQKLDNQNAHSEHIPLTISESAICFRFMLSNDYEGELFRRYYSFRSINECLDRFRRYIKNSPDPNIQQSPHLLVHISDAWTKCRKYGSEIADPTQFFIVSVH